MSGRMRDYFDRPIEPGSFAISEGFNETSEMLEGIEAIVLSIADRVDRLSATVSTVCEIILRDQKERST